MSEVTDRSGASERPSAGSGRTGRTASGRQRRAVKVRRARVEDIPGILEVQQAAYPGFPPDGLCNDRHFRLQLETFPDGQHVAISGDRIVGYSSTLIVILDDDSPWYSYSEITGNGTLSTHDPSGDTLYGAAIAVHPERRGQGIAGQLYGARKRVLKRFNLRRMVAGGRIPGYTEHAGALTPEEYVEKVAAGELKDMALNAHLKAGYHVRGVHMGYLRDEQSLDFATFLEMDNPDFNSEKRRIAASPIRVPVRKIRVCGAQYYMRRIESWEDLERQVEFFVSTADEYHCHFLLFPELFTAQMFSTMPPKLDSRDAAQRLADLHERYLELFKMQAKDSGIFIIAGSHPVRLPDGGLRNVAHLFTPSGNVYTQDKLHVTPSEREYYGIQPGEGIKIFDTGMARIAIQVCYDIEFPEVSRLLTLSGVEVIFCPFSTDERKAYQRVRTTAHARAIENMIYVVAAGNVGNLPQVDSFLINYGQSAVFTPSDFPFPIDGIAGEADLNSETVVITDLDLGSLEMEREMGSVKLLRDRRPDMYRIESRVPVEIIRTV